MNPKNKSWQVWIEGFAVNGQTGNAVFHGTYIAKTFKEAVEMWVNEDPEERTKHYRSNDLTYWACRFFDNKNDAIRSFG